MSQSSFERKITFAIGLDDSGFDLQEYLDKDQAALNRETRALEKELEDLEILFMQNQRAIHEKEVSVETLQRKLDYKEELIHSQGNFIANYQNEIEQEISKGIGETLNSGFVPKRINFKRENSQTRNLYQGSAQSQRGYSQNSI